MNKINDISIREMRELSKTETDINNMWKLLKGCKGDIWVLTNLAENLDSVKDTNFISELCKEGDSGVRLEVVKNIDDEDVLEKFIEDNDVVVRMALARKTKRKETIEKLSEDEWYGVRLELLFYNPNITQEIVKRMAKDDYYIIREHAKQMLKE